MQTIPSLGIALPATRSPDPRPPTRESGSSFADYLRTTDGRSSPSFASETNGPDKSSATDSDKNAGAEKQRITSEADADRRGVRAEARKATKDATTDREERDAKRVAKRSDDSADEHTIEDDHPVEATKVATAREHSDIHERVAKRTATAVADTAYPYAGESEGDLDSADDGYDGAERSASARNGVNKTRAGKTDTRAGTVGHVNKEETADSGVSKTARSNTPKSDKDHVDDANFGGGHADRGKVEAVDQDGAVKTAKENTAGKAGVPLNQQTMSGIAAKNGAVGAERADANATRPGERDGRMRLKGEKAGRIGETRGEVKSGEPARGSDETRKRIVADIEVNLREESDRDGARKSDTTLSDAGDRRSGAAETDSSSFLTRLEHAPNTPTQRQATAQQAAGTLARRLNGDLGTSIVRQAKVMLKEADQAEIRLIIRPPELGRVRINMHMENGHIAGRILVDNGSVREAVEQNLAALQRAFEEAGLEVGDFEVSTGDSRDEAADDRTTASRSGANRRRDEAGQFADSVEPVVVNDYSHRRINLVA